MAGGGRSTDSSMGSDVSALPPRFFWRALQSPGLWVPQHVGIRVEKGPEGKKRGSKEQKGGERKKELKLGRTALEVRTELRERKWQETERGATLGYVQMGRVRGPL